MMKTNDTRIQIPFIPLHRYNRGKTHPKPMEWGWKFGQKKILLVNKYSWNVLCYFSNLLPERGTNLFLCRKEGSHKKSALKELTNIFPTRAQCTIPALISCTQLALIPCLISDIPKENEELTNILHRQSDEPRTTSLLPSTNLPFIQCSVSIFQMLQR